MFTGTVFTISDMHIGHARSLATPSRLLDAVEKHQDHFGDEARKAFWETMEHNIRDADVVVFNGDIIDTGFNQSKAQNAQSSAAFVKVQFKRWAERYPKKTFYYVKGNHEGNYSDISKAIHGIGTQHSNVHVAQYGVVVGDTLFTHGDLQLADALSLSSRDPQHYKSVSAHGMSAEEKLITQHERLRDHLCSPHYQHDFMVLRHQENGATPTLTPLLPEEVKGKRALNMMFGHTHAASNLITWESQILGNSGMLKHDGNTQGRQIQSPKDLQQPLLRFENGTMLHQKCHAFPDADGSWMGMEEAARTGDRGRVALQTTPTIVFSN